MTALAPWRTRPAHEAFLLNPAFCARLLWLSVSEAGETGLSFELLFLPLPLVLHKPTRDRLPSTVRTPIGSWITENDNVRVGFAERCRLLVPLTREALLLLCTRELVVFEGSRVRVVGRIKASLKTDSGEVKDCVLRARFVGRWFAQAGRSAPIFTLFGVRP